MRIAGAIAFTLGILLATVGAARTPPHAGLLVAGVVLVVLRMTLGRRKGGRGGARPPGDASAGTARPAHGAAAADGAALSAVLHPVLEGARALRSQADTLSFGTMRTRLDTLLEDAVQAFIERVAAWHGAGVPEAFAAVAGPFATAERFLFRAWSASADEHRGELVASLDSAVAYLGDVEAELARRGA